METPADPWPNGDMTEDTTPQAEPSVAPPLPTEHTSEAPYPRRLERIEEDKWIAGVATGLAEYFSVPTWLVRLIFVFLLAPAGIGVLTYLALVAIMPHESEDESPAERWFGHSDNPERTIGIGLTGIAVLILLASTTSVDGGAIVALALLGIGVLLYQRGSSDGQQPAGDSAEHTPGRGPGDDPASGGRPPREPRPRTPREPKPPRPQRPRRPKSNLGAYTVSAVLIALGLLASADIAGMADPKAFHYVALAVAVIGLGLVVGAWRGRSRGLILLGLAALPLLGVTWVTGNVDTIIGEWERLADADDVHHNEFITLAEVNGSEALNFGIGDVTVDLTATNFSNDGRLDIRMDAGQLTVIVPDDVRVRAEVDLGDIDRPGHDLDGFDLSTTFGPPLGDADGYVTVRLDIGQVVIVEGN